MFSLKQCSPDQNICLSMGIRRCAICIVVSLSTLYNDIIYNDIEMKY